jgi:hypothetical protein
MIRWMILGILIALIFSVVLVCSGPARGDDRASIVKLLKKRSPDMRVGTMKIAGSWALAEVGGKEWEGNALLHVIEGDWQVVTLGGGVIDVVTMSVMGVPKELLRSLLLYEPPASAFKEAASQGPYWTWLTSDRVVDAEELRGKSAWELTLMRNEIYARHGRSFKDPDLRAYFRSRSWYHEDPGFSDSKLTEKERRNASFIMKYQQEHNLLY